MKVVFSRQALTDLDEIATYYSTHASPTIAAAVERAASTKLLTV
jgi:plasmid stabilization system protein ParE